MHVYIHTEACVCAEEGIGFSLPLHPTNSPEVGSLPESGAHLGLAESPPASVIFQSLPLLELGLQAFIDSAGVLRGYQDPHSGPHNYGTSTLN